MKRVSIIGSTGSIGTQALDVLDRNRDRFAAVALAGGRQVAVLAEQVRRVRPELVSAAGPAEAKQLAELLGPEAPEIMHGPAGLRAVATHPGAGLVLTAVVGSMGLEPTLAAIAAGKDIALANKETLVAAGELVMAEAVRRGVRIVPVDSEHSALFQCLNGEDTGAVKRLILTGSGGPFRGRKELSGITPAEALRHPRWAMGPKITVDSATLMNKALEMIEAHFLFGVTMEQVEVLIHPQSIVHSLVEFVDGSVVAQLGITDMRLPIQYALGFPGRLPGFLPALDLAELGSLTFERPDERTFPSLNYARRAVTMGGTMPAAINAANEVAVGRFLQGEIPFAGIFATVKAVLERHEPAQNPSLAAILEADAWGRRTAAALQVP
jgi:1-deoxy-D-xylulose-5-phosphate reductoisomerase